MVRMVTKFQHQVYALLKKIPKGRVTTYKEIGRALGKKGQVYRAVGNALHKNPFAPSLPCHRVIASDGTIGGFSKGSAAKKRLLKEEGINIKKNKVVDFKKLKYVLMD